MTQAAHRTFIHIFLRALAGDLPENYRMLTLELVKFYDLGLWRPFDNVFASRHGFLLCRFKVALSRVSC